MSMIVKKFWGRCGQFRVHSFFALAILGNALLYADPLSHFAQALTTLAPTTISDLQLLEEIRKLPQVPQKSYPVAQHFTSDLFLKTIYEFVALMGNRIQKGPWLKGGTDNYLFVRKLIVPADAVIAVRGDLHGDVHSLIRWLDELRDEGWFEKDHPFTMTQDSIKKQRYIAFLGDYSDRGKYGAEIFYIIMKLFLHNPDNILIIRGNHEDVDINGRLPMYGGGFFLELLEKFPSIDDTLWQAAFTKLYNTLPVALFLGCDNGKSNKDAGFDFIQCCHGGMEPGYSPRFLLYDSRSDLYEWLDKDIDFVDKERGLAACKRAPHLAVELTKTDLCVNGLASLINGFQWNDFDFFNEKPNELISSNRRGSYDTHQRYTTELLRTSTDKSSNNKVWSVFRAHQHDSDTVPHILEYGNGLYKLWSKNTTKPKQWNGKENEQWSGKKGDPVAIEKYSVWTFNVAPRTGYYEKKSNKFTYDTTAELHLAPGFDKWTLYPRQIPVK